MNSKKIGLGLSVIVLIVIVIGGIVIFNNWKSQHKSHTQQSITTVAEAYYLQNSSFQIYNGNLETYRPYSDINEDFLQNALNSYNTYYSRTGATLSLQDVKDYLSSETNADGSPRTYLNCNDQKIWDFLDWKGSRDSSKLDLFIYDEQSILNDYSKTHPKYAGKEINDLTDDEHHAIIHKIYDPDYNLDLENPDSWKALDSASSAVG